MLLLSHANFVVVVTAAILEKCQIIISHEWSSNATCQNNFSPFLVSISSVLIASSCCWVWKKTSSVLSWNFWALSERRCSFRFHHRFILCASFRWDEDNSTFSAKFRHDTDRVNSTSDIYIFFAFNTELRSFRHFTLLLFLMHARRILVVVDIWQKTQSNKNEIFVFLLSSRDEDVRLRRYSDIQKCSEQFSSTEEKI